MTLLQPPMLLCRIPVCSFLSPIPACPVNDRIVADESICARTVASASYACRKSTRKQLHGASPAYTAICTIGDIFLN
jgi:hypothetical protein